MDTEVVEAMGHMVVTNRETWPLSTRLVTVEWNTLTTSFVSV